MDLLRINWDAAVSYCEQLAAKIEFKPDIIIGISRGGLVPARILSDILDVKRVAILGISFYKGIKETEEKPEITQDISINVKGMKILIVDDVADTGKSLLVAKEYIERAGAIEVKTATLHFKPASVFKPDYYIGMTKAWLVYPWEVNEAERTLKE